MAPGTSQEAGCVGHFGLPWGVRSKALPVPEPKPKGVLFSNQLSVCVDFPCREKFLDSCLPSTATCQSVCVWLVAGQGC